jgi:hypothetical protein
MFISGIGPLGGYHFSDTGFSLPEWLCKFDDIVH